MANLEQINKKFLEANTIRDDLEVLDAQFDGEQYFLKTTENLYGQFTFRSTINQFKEYFPNLKPSDSTMQFKFGYKIKVNMGVGYNLEENEFIHDKNPEIHDYKLLEVKSRNEDISDEEFQHYIEDTDTTLKEILEERAEYLTNYNNFSLE